MVVLKHHLCMDIVVENEDYGLFQAICSRQSLTISLIRTMRSCYLEINVWVKLKATVSTMTIKLVSLGKDQRTCFNCFSSFSFSIWQVFIYIQTKAFVYQKELRWLVPKLILTQLPVTCSEAQGVKHQQQYENSQILDFPDMQWFYFEITKWSLENWRFLNCYSSLLGPVEVYF